MTKKTPPKWVTHKLTTAPTNLTTPTTNKKEEKKKKLSRQAGMDGSEQECGPLGTPIIEPLCAFCPVS